MRGEGHYHTNLTEEQVRDIRARYASGRLSQRVLGAEYGLTKHAIHLIVKRTNWKHVA